MGQVQFGIPESLVLWLKEAVGAKTLVETGTNEGRSAAWAAKYFDRVVTVEGYEPLYKKVSQDPARAKNIEFLFGDSRTVLPGVLKSLKGPAIFWLDAHWCSAETFGAAHECPVLDEVAVVNQSGGNHIILIDDARLFVKPPPAPHRASDWPGLVELCANLSPASTPRYVAVEQDVIAAVPESLRESFVEHLRSIKPPQKLAPSLPARIKGKVKRALGNG